MEDWAEIRRLYRSEKLSQDFLEWGRNCACSQLSCGGSGVVGGLHHSPCKCLKFLTAHWAQRSQHHQ